MFTEIYPVQLELHHLDLDGTIVPVVVEFFAEDYDPDLCSNGGSYARESFVVDFSSDEHHANLSVDDTSCGDFGSRFSASLTVTGAEVASANFGTMLDQQACFSSFSLQRAADYTALAIAASGMFNLYIPDENDFEEETEQ